MRISDRDIKPELALLERMRDTAPAGTQTRAYLEGAVTAIHYLAFGGTRPSDIARAMAVTERGAAVDAIDKAVPLPPFELLLLASENPEGKI